MRPSQFYPLADTTDIYAVLAHYEGGYAMAAHDHDVAQLSFLLAGSIEETVGGRVTETAGGGTGCKAAGLTHANRYGRDGALILSLNIRADSPLAPDCETWRWTSSDRVRPEAAHLVRLLDGDGEAALIDLAALALPGRKAETAASLAPDRRPPAWLARLKERLVEGEEPDELTHAAREAGVHPVYLSRAFRAAFGVAPSLFRLRCRLARALAALRTGSPAAEAAEAGGFSDQSHLTRTLRRETGLTPAGFSRMMAG